MTSMVNGGVYYDEEFYGNSNGVCLGIKKDEKIICFLAGSHIQGKNLFNLNQIYIDKNIKNYKKYFFMLLIEMILHISNSQINVEQFYFVFNEDENIPVSDILSFGFVPTCVENSSESHSFTWKYSSDNLENFSQYLFLELDNFVRLPINIKFNIYDVKKTELLQRSNSALVPEICQGFSFLANYNVQIITPQKSDIVEICKVYGELEISKPFLKTLFNSKNIEEKLDFIFAFQEKLTGKLVSVIYFGIDEKNNGYIVDLETRHFYQNRGLGSLLLLIVIKQLETSGVNKIKIREATSDGEKLYVKFGFKPIVFYDSATTNTWEIFSDAEKYQYLDGYENPPPLILELKDPSVQGKLKFWMEKLKTPRNQASENNNNNNYNNKRPADSELTDSSPPQKISSFGG